MYLYIQFSSKNKIDLPFPTSEFKLRRRKILVRSSSYETDINREGSSSPKRISSSFAIFIFFRGRVEGGSSARRVQAAAHFYQSGRFTPEITV